MAQTAPSRTIADTVTVSQELREDGQIDGQVKLYNVDTANEFEADAELFFDRTLMTNGLREALTILRDSLVGDDPRSTHILYGSYGSGKSHQLVTLYHCFAAPEVAETWAGEEIDGFANALPDTALPITVSLQNKQPDYLWEPFFDALDHDLESYAEGGYPDMETIREAVGNRTVAFFVDELEDWFETLSGDALKANRGFLQVLLEATSLNDLDLHTVVSVLREESVVHNILNREQAVEVNMNNQVDKREVLHHRLIETVDGDAAREIVDGYVDAYEDADHVEESMLTGLREAMYDSYPFHPVLLDALETRYYADEGNQNTRGMIYLFSKVLLASIGADAEASRDLAETDLITHGDIDAEAFEDELSRINYERLTVCVNDIDNRVDESQVPHGRRILNTILLYSLKPSEGEGADVSEIVLGAFQTGSRVSDVVLDVERLHGVAWHLHKLNGKYAIRDRQNPNALIRNAANDVSETAAKAEVGDILRELFGTGAHTVGFRTDDIREVPDEREIRVVLKDSTWTEEEVREVITNGGRGREWRNTLVFVQPTGEKAVESGTRYIDKARYLEGARQILADESLDAEIRTSVEEMKSQEEQELREELKLLYGEVLDGDNLLDDFDLAAQMPLDNFVDERAEIDAGNIAQSAAADPLDLQQHVWPIVEDLLNRRGKVSIEDVYEQFLQQPTYPIPGDAGAVLDATVDALGDRPVLVHDEDGFRDDPAGSSLDTVLLDEDNVEEWTVDDIEQELRRRFGDDDTEIGIGELELELLKSTDVRLMGEDSHDAVMMAVGRLNHDDAYVIVRGSELLDKPELDGTLRDVSDATVIDASSLSERVQKAIEADGMANMEKIIGEIRKDKTVFLPAEDTGTTVRDVVNDRLVGDYLIEVDGRYVEALGDRDPLTVTLVPTVEERIGEKITAHIGTLEPGDSFTVSSVADRYDSSVTEDAVKTFLLSHLGSDADPVYVTGREGSEDPSAWTVGDPFRIPGDEGWRFEYNGDDIEALRRKWRDEHETGVVSYGDVTLTLPDREGVPSALQGTASVTKTNVSLTLESGQDWSTVPDLFERLPATAENLKIEISFE